jgi:hypothetical protein
MNDKYAFLWSNMWEMANYIVLLHDKEINSEILSSHCHLALIVFFAPPSAKYIHSIM